VLDRNTPGGSTLEALPELRAELGETQIVVLTMHNVRTVETHRAHIQQKWRLGTRAELVRYAPDHALIEAH
jgi:two-component system response regulator NreC